MAGLVATALLVLAGCGSEDGDGAADTAPTSSGTDAFVRSVPGADYKVPAVSDPLDTTAFVDAPCSLLDAAGAARLQVGEGSATGDGSCTWRAGGDDVDVLVAGVRASSLSSFYDQYIAGGDGSWEPTTVAGRPGALVNGPFERSAGSCVLLVAAADDAYLRIERGMGASQDDACADAVEAAGSLLATLGAS